MKKAGSWRWIAGVALAGILMAGPAALAQIWINPMSAGTPMGTYTLGDTLGDWNVNFEIGQQNWDNAQVGIGTNLTGADYDWGTANWYEDGDWPNKRVRRNLNGFQFTATGNYYVVCQARAGSGDTYTSKSGNGWGNPTDYPPADLASAYFQVDAPGVPTDVSAARDETNTATRADLAWTRWSDHNVLITVATDTPTGSPEQGAGYVAEDTFGNQTVISGSQSGTELEVTGLIPGETYYFTFYTENYSYYSAGETAAALAMGMPQAQNTGGGSPQAPSTIHLGDTGLTFGLDSWGMLEANWGAARLWLRAGNSDLAGGTAGEWSVYTNIDNKTRVSGTFNSTGTWYWGMQMDYGAEYGTNFWYKADSTEWADLSDNGAGATLSVTVSPINDPTDQQVTAQDIDQIDLSFVWNAQGNNVMVVRKLPADSWTEPTQGMAYSVDDTIGAGTVIYSGAGPTVSVTGLVADTTYDFKFYSVNNDYYSPGVMAQGTTDCIGPDAPTGLYANPTNYTDFTANWTAVDGAAGYRLDVSTDEDFPALSFVDGYENRAVAGTSQAVTGLTEAVTYYFRVRAESGGGCPSANSETGSVATLESLQLELSDTTVNVREGGEGRFYVRLNQAPDEDVIVLVTHSTGDAGVTVGAGSTRVFTPANWSTWQAVTLAAGAGAGPATFQVAADGLVPGSVEAAVLGDLGDNLALASAGTTMSSLGATSAGSLIDGTHDQYANRGFTSWTRTPPGWIILDLQSPTVVTNMRLLNWDWTVRYNTYRIEGSFDGSAWTVLADASDPRHGWDVWELESDPIRYLRFTGLSNTVNAAVIMAEWEVYGEHVSVQQDQTISFPEIPDQWTPDTVELSATASSGLPVSFAVESGPAEIDEGDGVTMTFTGPGEVSIVASQAGDGDWYPAPDVTNTFTVSDLLYDIEVSKTAVNVREDGEGRFFVRLGSEPAGSVVVTVTRSAGDAGVTVASGASRTFTASDWDEWQAVTLAAAAGAETATIQVAADGAATRTVDAAVLGTPGDNLALESEGTTVTSSGAAAATNLVDGIHDEYANRGYTSWTRDPDGWITLDLQSPVVVTNMRLLNWDWTYRLNAYQIEGSLEGQDWTVLADASAPRHGWDEWELESDPVRYLRFTGLSNTVNFAVIAAEWEVYGERVTVLADQTIDFPAIDDQRITNTVSLSATASSGLSVGFAVQSGPAELDGTTLTFTGTGDVTIRATQAGDATWAPADPVDRTFAVLAVNDILEVSWDDVNVREGGEGRFFVRLNEEPASPVTVTIAHDSGDAGLSVQSGATWVFSAANWNRWLPVTLAEAADADAVNETAVFRVSAAGAVDALVDATALDTDIGDNAALASAGTTVSGFSVTRPELVNDGTHLQNGNYAHTIWNRTTPGWMTLDLQGSVEATRLRLLNWDWTHRVHRYTVEVSLDGSSWTTVADASAGEWHGWNDWELDGSAIRYVRFTGLYNSVHGAVCIAELEVYAADPPEGSSMPSKSAVADGEPDGLQAAVSIPVTVLTSDGPEDETGWLAVDGDPETAWIGRKTGGGYLVIGYEPALDLAVLEVDMVEGSLTTLEFLYSLDAEEWLPLPEDMETNPVELNYLWLIFEDDGTDAVPQVIEVRPNP